MLRCRTRGVCRCRARRVGHCRGGITRDGRHTCASLPTPRPTSRAVHGPLETACEIIRVSIGEHVHQLLKRMFPPLLYLSWRVNTATTLGFHDSPFTGAVEERIGGTCPLRVFSCRFLRLRRIPNQTMIRYVSICEEFIWLYHEKRNKTASHAYRLAASTPSRQHRFSQTQHQN
jgi:hypothetical protein